MNDDLSQFSMMDLFRMEADTQVAALTSALLVLESNPTEASAKAEELMRAAHSLKGAARLVNLELAVKLAHALEDVFVAVQEGKLGIQSEDVDVLLRGVDFLAGLSKLQDAQVESWSAEKKPECDDLVQHLHKILRGEKASAPASSIPVAPPPPEPALEPAPAPVAEKQPEPVPAPVTPPPKIATPARTAAVESKSEDRVVRVSAENLNRLVELAAESLVEARRMQPFGDALLQLKNIQTSLESDLWLFRDALQRGWSGEAPLARLRNIEERCESLRLTMVRRLEDFEGLARRSTGVSEKLYREVIASRMRPFQEGISGFPRMVRDLARTLGKKVQFKMLGTETEVDRDILEKLEAPLNHILRNALDHGLETPDERIKAGKSPEGQVTLEARHAAGMLHITLGDDGRGIIREKLRRKIVDKALAAAGTAAQLTDAELLEFLFLPGFSTAEKVTEVSGRGVGLDVVQTMLQEAGGTVRISSQEGQGTTFHLHLPITRSVIRALLAQICGKPYAFPLPRIDRVVRVPREELESLEGRLYLKLNGKNVGMVPAREVLELENGDESGSLVCVLVVSDRDHQYGLEVDSFMGERDLVVRPLDKRLGKVADISSASILEDGTPILIVDVDDLVRSMDTLLAGGRIGRTKSAAVSTGASSKRKRILVADDSITVRELERQLLQSQGYAVDVAVDGMEAWNAFRLGQYELVVTDVDMPRMTGIELVKMIRGNEKGKNVPVVIVSYKDREADKVKGMEAGANYYLTKSSFQDNTFNQAVQELIGKAQE